MKLSLAMTAAGDRLSKHLLIAKLSTLHWTRLAVHTMMILCVDQLGRSLRVLDCVDGARGDGHDGSQIKVLDDKESSGKGKHLLVNVMESQRGNLGQRVEAQAFEDLRDVPAGHQTAVKECPTRVVKV